MIKTTSFALPRPSQPSSKPQSRARHHAIKTAKTRATIQTQPSLEALFPAPTPVPEISAAQARELIQSTAPKPRSKAKAAPSLVAPITSQPVPEIETIMPSTSPALKKTPRPRATKSNDPSPVTPQVPAIVAARIEIEAAPVEVAEATAEKPAPRKAVSEGKKSRRPRVPTNLAEQYGQSLSKRVENGAEDVTEDDSPKKRLSRAERQARRELMNPDDDLLARLHRVHNAVPTAKPVKRPPGWRFDCGRCGQTSYFRTSGALCNCGALAIKE
ncbi:hypothetical protein EON80_32825 [bacterium]|nr:MAG: hypothetical protein EON80_32825 [bacterium]